MGGLGHVIGATFQSRGPEMRMETGKAIPRFVNDDFDAVFVRCIDDGLQVVTQAIVSGAGEDDGFGMRMRFDGGQYRF